MGTLKGLFFDLDGVIVESERDGHRVAFNKTFKEFGYSFQWGVDEYQELIKISGGKERMRFYLHSQGFAEGVSPEALDDLVQRMHNFKTGEFIKLIESGELPLRPGVRRIMQEANASGLVIGICTTANQRAAHAVVDSLLAEIRVSLIIAGDMVANKKPDPDVYEMALSLSGLAPDQCIVFEDSRNGLMAAMAAGLRVIITKSVYTQDEDFTGADLVLTSLGDLDGEESRLVFSKKELGIDRVLCLGQIRDYFS